jgi:hypothetical protein
MPANRSAEVRGNVAAIAAEFAAARGDRIQRRTLSRIDFDRLADAGFLLTGVPVDQSRCVNMPSWYAFWLRAIPV